MTTRRAQTPPIGPRYAPNDQNLPFLSSYCPMQDDPPPPLPNNSPQNLQQQQQNPNPPLPHITTNPYSHHYPNLLLTPQQQLFQQRQLTNFLQIPSSSSSQVNETIANKYKKNGYWFNDVLSQLDAPGVYMDLQDVTSANIAQNGHNMTTPDGGFIPLLRWRFAPFDPMTQGVIDQQQQRLELLVATRNAEMTERFVDMAVSARHLAVVARGQLSREERVLFYIAHSRIIQSLRSSIMTLNQHFTNEHTRLLAREYRKNIEYELKTFLKSLLDFVLGVILPHSYPDHQVFFLKFVADCYKYIAEIDPINNISAVALSRSYYHDASLLAEHYLPISSPIRLSLLLNYTVAAYELFRDYRFACEMAKMTFDKAIQLIGELDDEDYRDATLVLQVIRDNLSLWVTMQNSVAHPALTFPTGMDILTIPNHPSTLIHNKSINIQKQTNMAPQNAKAQAALTNILSELPPMSNYEVHKSSNNNNAATSQGGSSRR